MRVLVKIALVSFISLFALTPTTNAAGGGKEIVKAIARFIARETGEEVTDQVVKSMTKQVGEELIQRTSAKVLREGGERSLVEVGELVARHGPDAIRALDNAPDAVPILKLLDEMPADDIGKAVSRLAAGSSGKELATLSTKLGSTVLKAETKHPGVGLAFAKALGKDGAELSLKLSGDQAIQIGRHVDDMGKLPAPQQKQLLELISDNAGRFASFVGRFVEANPGKVLFTAAGTTVILSQAERVLGGAKIVYGADGNPTVVDMPGLIDRAIDKGKDTLDEPIQQTANTLNWLLGMLGTVSVIAVAVVLYSKSRKIWAADRVDEAKLGQDETPTTQKL